MICCLLVQPPPYLRRPRPSPLVPLPRRSTADRNAQLVTAAGNLSTVRGNEALGGSKNKDDGHRTVAPANGDKTAAPSATATKTVTAAASAAATTTGKELDQSESKRRGSRRPTRGGGENHSSSSPAGSPSKRTTAPVEHQRGRNVSGGLGDAARAAAGGADEEGTLEVESMRQAGTGAKAAAPTGTHDETGTVDGTAVVTGAAEALADVATTTECGASGGDTGVVVSGVDDAASDPPIYGRWPATLDAQWAEVEFMLCHEVNCEESLQYTIDATEAGLVFMDKLEEKAQVRFTVVVQATHFEV